MFYFQAKKIMIVKTKGILNQIFRSKRTFPISINYNEYWLSKRGKTLGTVLNNFQIERFTWALNRIHENSSLIDLGSGDGVFINFLQNKKKNITTFSADISEYVSSSNNKNNHIVCDISSPEQVRSLGSYDYVSLFEVIEHIPNSEELVQSAIKIARKSIFISIPNTGYFPFRLRLLFGKFPDQWKVHPGEHLRFWTCTDFSIWLENILQDEQVIFNYYEGIPLLNKLLPKLFAAGIVCEIRKK